MDDKDKVIPVDFERWFTDAEIDQMEARLDMAESVTLPKPMALRIIRRLRAAPNKAPKE